MSKEVKTQEQETPKSNKKYIALALVAILAVIGIVKNNVSNKETVVTSTTAPEVTKNVIEKKPVEEPTVARIDLVTPSQNDEVLFEIYVNGSNVPEKEPDWLSQLKSSGYIVRKDDGKINIVVSIIKDVDINIYLRGKDQRNKNNKIVKNWVKFTSVTINGEEILSEPVSVWHNKPFKYTLNAKAGEEYKIHAEWTKADIIPEE